MKYELLIKDILKHTKRAGLIDEGIELERALNIMRVRIDTFNSLLFINSYYFRSFQKLPMT